MAVGQPHQSVMLDNIPVIHLPEPPQESPPQLQESPSPLAPSPLQNLPEENILEAATDVSSQSTPTNGPFREIMKNESGLGIKADEDESQAVLHSFREQFGEGTNPKDVLVVVEKSSHLDGGGYYLCFRLAYPLATASRHCGNIFQPSTFFSIGLCQVVLTHSETCLTQVNKEV